MDEASPLAAVLQGLRSHDERLVGQLASRQDAKWDDRAASNPVRIGQHIANLRRKGAKNGLDNTLSGPPCARRS
ncbi:hypothetical protein [Streptomyces sp. NPDC003395]